MNITSRVEGETLYITVLGRVDSTNAFEFGETTAAAIAASRPRELVFDLLYLHYISSAGLRVFIKAARQVPRLRAVNVAPEVYDVFDMTGLNQVIDVRRSLRTVDVTGKPVIGRGTNGVVYHFDDETIVKAFTGAQTEEDIRRQMEKSRQALLAGVPTTITFDVVRIEGGVAGETLGAVYEMAGADTLANVIARNPQQVRAYAAQAVDLLRQINGCQGDTDLFQPVAQSYREGVDRLASFFTRGELTQLRSYLASMPSPDTLVHGDFHPQNIMVADGELWAIDLDGMKTGHPVHEVCGLYTNLVLNRNTLVKRYGPNASVFGLPAPVSDQFYELVRDGMLESVPRGRRETFFDEALTSTDLRMIAHLGFRAYDEELVGRVLPAIKRRLFPLRTWRLG